MDIIWLAKNSQGVLTRIITIILLIFKVRVHAYHRHHHQNHVDPVSHRYQLCLRSPTAFVKPEVLSAGSTSEAVTLAEPQV